MSILPNSTGPALWRENSGERPYQILIVEDSADDVKLFLRALQKVEGDMDREIKPFVLSNGTEAAARILDQKFDAIFLDINLPPPDGVELTRRVRNSTINRTTPVVILTGAEDRGLMTRAFQAGANLFLAKPIDRMRLLRLLQVSSVPIDRERRRLQRVKVKCKVTFEPDESGPDRFDAQTVDISLNGMLVRSDRVLPVGAVVNVSLTLVPGAEPIRTPARIVRVIGNELMALTMETLGKAESARVGEFLVPLIASLAKVDD